MRNVEGMSKSPSQLIEQQGGATVFAAAIGRKANAVRLWKFRERIPRSAWPEIVEAFPSLTLDVLKEIEGGAA